MPGEAIAAHIVYAIKSYAEEHPGTSAAQITRTLEKTIPEEDMPSDRTVQRYVEEVRKADISEAWNPTASTFDTEATRDLTCPKSSKTSDAPHASFACTPRTTTSTPTISASSEIAPAATSR